ncbi:hypothetical protein FB45DRAFT_429931 [Roridomyces roridus]|uniref:Uncharacterized protein n=1 Tax=Roridomyces roridus TaxID=1738132 RepID=A0AAD7F9N1_9AGAR|nr:hypothetical protein FB45DRAFT_429931 [Roridomyces roridus]
MDRGAQLAILWQGSKDRRAGVGATPWILRGAPATNATSCLAEELNHSPPSHSRYRALKSKTAQVAKLGRNKPFVVASCLDARFLSRLRPFFRLVWMTFFGDLPSEDIARKRFRANASFADDSESLDESRERLLEYKAGEGWERVCILLAPSDSESLDDPEVTTGIEQSPGEYLSDTRVLGEKMNKITYGVFQGYVCPLSGSKY